MITKADVRQARTNFDLHCAEHKCHAGECNERLELWVRINQLALLWEKS
jgi:hypothetical protein